MNFKKLMNNRVQDSEMNNTEFEAKIKQVVPGIVSVSYGKDDEGNNAIFLSTQNAFVDMYKLEEWKAATGASNIMVGYRYDRQYGLSYRFSE